MTTKILTLFCVISYDNKKKNSCVLSVDSKQIILPYTNVEHTKSLKNEIRYKIKTLLDGEKYKLNLEDILISYLDIQNDLCLDYLSNNNYYNFSIDNDICLLCGVILDKNYKTSLNWVPANLLQDLTKKQSVDFIVDHVAQGAVI